jgi:hypothetical protein
VVSVHRRRRISSHDPVRPPRNAPAPAARATGPATPASKASPRNASRAGWFLNSFPASALRRCASTNSRLLGAGD